MRLLKVIGIFLALKVREVGEAFSDFWRFHRKAVFTTFYIYAGLWLVGWGLIQMPLNFQVAVFWHSPSLQESIMKSHTEAYNQEGPKEVEETSILVKVLLICLGFPLLGTSILLVNVVGPLTLLCGTFLIIVLACQTIRKFFSWIRDNWEQANEIAGRDK